MKQHNKKVVKLILSIAIMLSFSACASISFQKPSTYVEFPDEYISESDYPIYFCANMDYTITPSEKGYFIYSGPILIFFDRESGFSAPVCNRPDCLHEDENCRAYFDHTRKAFIQCYENHLYLETAEYDANGYLSYWMYRVNPEDCTRERVCQLPYPGESCKYMMHRGYLYMTHYDIKDPKSQKIVLERVALSELEEKSLTPERLFEKETMSYGPAYIYGNHLYIPCSQPLGAEGVDFIWTDVNLKTLECKEIKMPDIDGVPEPTYMQFQTFNADGVVATYIDLDTILKGDYSMTYYHYDPETEEYRHFLTLPDRGEGFWEFYAWDGKHHMTFYVDMAATVANPRLTQEVRILDGNFETQKRIGITGSLYGFIAGDADFSFIEAYDENGSYLYAIDKRGEELKIVKVFE